MSNRLLSAAVAALLLSGAAPALARQVAAPAPQTAPAPEADDEAKSPEEAAVEAAGEAFGARIEAMSKEMEAAVTAAGADKAKAKTDLDAIQARYQPDADAFADTLTAFVQSQMAAIPDAQRAEAEAKLPVMSATIKGLPAQLRELIEANAATPAATAPDAATPPAS